jgi:hypothetical protein
MNLEMEPTVGGEPLTTLMELIVQHDRGDDIDCLPHDLDENFDGSADPLRRALLRIEGRMLLDAADDLRGRRRPSDLDPEMVRACATDRLFEELAASYGTWRRSRWFPDANHVAYRRTVACAQEFGAIVDRELARRAELQGRIDAAFARADAISEQRS